MIRALHDFDIDVVAIEKSARRARRLRRPRAARTRHRRRRRPARRPCAAPGYATARALIVLTTDDVANLETALVGQGLRPDLRVVVRLFDGEMADRVERTFPNTVSRSVSYLVAPAFAAAMLGREVIGTIPVGRRLLLVAELSVGAGSVLEARPAGRRVGAGPHPSVGRADGSGRPDALVTAAGTAVGAYRPDCRCRDPHRADRPGRPDRAVPGSRPPGLPARPRRAAAAAPPPGGLNRPPGATMWRAQPY